MAIFLLAPQISYGLEVTLSNSADNLAGVAFIQNIGTSGVVIIRQSGGYPAIPIWLNQGESIQVGRFWAGAKVTGTDAGVTLTALYG